MMTYKYKLFLENNWLPEKWQKKYLDQMRCAVKRTFWDASGSPASCRIASCFYHSIVIKRGEHTRFFIFSEQLPRTVDEPNLEQF
jgi:hypothetical protein